MKRGRWVLGLAGLLAAASGLRKNHRQPLRLSILQP